MSQFVVIRRQIIPMRLNSRFFAFAILFAFLGAAPILTRAERNDEHVVDVKPTTDVKTSDSARFIPRRQTLTTNRRTAVVEERVATETESAKGTWPLNGSTPFYVNQPPRVGEKTTTSFDDEELMPLAEPQTPDLGEPRYSGWARFPVGSWARSRTASESVENGKRVHTATETRTSLIKVDTESRRYALQYDSTIKVGDVNVMKRSEVVEYDFWDLPVDESAAVSILPHVILTIDGQSIPCCVRRVVSTSGRVKTTTTIWYSPVAPPYIFQRETTHETVDSDQRGEMGRELYVVQRVRGDRDADPDPILFEALFSSSTADRNAVGSSLRSFNVPGAILRESYADADSRHDEPQFNATTSLLDYYVPNAE